MAKRSFPRSVILFGLANTVLGFCGLISGVSALIRPHMTVAQNVYQQVDLPAQSFQWLHIAQVWSPISFAVMLACGIGLLQRKQWGRTLAIVYCIATIGFSLIFSCINIARLASLAPNTPMILNIILSIVLSVLFGLVYKIAMLYCLSRPRVKEALAHQTTGAEILEFKPRRRRR